jgi:hypothetical protein
MFAFTLLIFFNLSACLNSFSETLKACFTGKEKAPCPATARISFCAKELT